MPHNTMPLEGFAILLVEDEPLIALDLAITLEDAGAVVIGPCANVDEALSIITQKADHPTLSGAVLDVDLGDETSIPIARELQVQGIPFVFHTGMDLKKADMLREFDAPIIAKPSTPATLVAGISARIGI